MSVELTLWHRTFANDLPQQFHVDVKQHEEEREPSEIEISDLDVEQ